ncbi:MAG TPA: MFS transporter [Fimbriimonadaceae bacterium]|nr:MFS transporter [Fimbriimonadaceae bacterium]
MTAALSPQEEMTLRRDWRLFAALTFLFSFGFAVYSGPFQNFLRDVLRAHELDLGKLESFREIPGLCAALMTGTLVALAEARIAAFGLMAAAVGIAVSGICKSFPPLIAITVFWSVGFHLWSTMQNAITLALAKGKEGGRHLGRMSGIGAVATIAGLGAAYLLSLLKSPYWGYFVLAGATIFAAGILAHMLSTHSSSGVRERIVVRREYGLFYLLSFLEGCRRQIFSIFASFALILVYEVPVAEMLAIQLVNSVMIAFTAPAMGKMVDRRGERGPLTFYAIGLILVFFGYAHFENRYALIALFLIDNVLFSFGVGFTTYLHRIVRPGDLTPCLAMGVTMNHIAAVTVPLFGALLWQDTGNYHFPFWVGVAISAVSLVATRFLPKGAGAVRVGSPEYGSGAEEGVSPVIAELP